MAKLKHEVMLTPEEVLEQHPCLRINHNWDTTTPGYLHSIGLLDGKYLKGKRMMLIYESSLVKMIDIYKNRLHNKLDDLV